MAARASSALWPLISATAMNTAGKIRPRSGWIQRASASKPLMRPLTERDDRLVVEGDFVGGEGAFELALQAQFSRRGLDQERIAGRRGRRLSAEFGERIAEAIEDDAQHHAQHRVGARHAVGDLLGVDRQQHAVVDCLDAGRSRPLVDDRHLADDLAGPADGDDLFAIGTGDQNLDPTFLDEISARRRVAFAEQILLGGKLKS